VVGQKCASQLLLWIFVPAKHPLNLELSLNEYWRSWHARETIIACKVGEIFVQFSTKSPIPLSCGPNFGLSNFHWPIRTHEIPPHKHILSLSRRCTIQPMIVG
jgi:hypothetical protein